MEKEREREERFIKLGRKKRLARMASPPFSRIRKLYHETNISSSTNEDVSTAKRNDYISWSDK